MGEHRALRPAAAAGGVEHERGGVGLGHRRPFDFVDPNLVGDETRPEIIEDRATLVIRQPRVERRHDRAELERAQQRRREGPAIRNRERDPIARAHAGAGQESREAAGAPAERRVVERAVPREDRRVLGVKPCCGFERYGKIL